MSRSGPHLRATGRAATGRASATGRRMPADFPPVVGDTAAMALITADIVPTVGVLA